MSIDSSIAKILIREHCYKPITGRVLTLGRQTIAMTYEEALGVMAKEGYVPPQNVTENIHTEYDQNTRVGKGSNYVSDNVFFQLFGITELASLDVTDYECADIIHNINYPIPADLEGQFDFIIDGGTFDHLFDVRVAFENVVKMLKPEGRILQWNAASNFTGAAYLSFGPDLFHDYFVLNKFVDCKVYIAEVNGEKRDFYEFDGSVDYGHLMSSGLQEIFVLAEKGPDSTWDKMSVQRQYRNDSLNEEFNLNLKSISASKRNYFSNIDGETVTRKKKMAFKANLVELKHRMPETGKKLVPTQMKRMINNNLRGISIKGFTYVGRV